MNLSAGQNDTAECLLRQGQLQIPIKHISRDPPPYGVSPEIPEHTPHIGRGDKLNCLLPATTSSPALLDLRRTFPHSPYDRWSNWCPTCDPPGQRFFPVPNQRAECDHSGHSVQFGQAAGWHTWRVAWSHVCPMSVVLPNLDRIQIWVCSL